jgi:hypothetical protein
MTTLLFSAVLLLQYPYPGRAQVRQPNPVRSPADTDAVATFNGTFKSADKKFLYIDVEDGNTMKMYITGSTKFFRDDKPAKASDFHQGDSVTVDVSRDSRLNMLAVRVTEVPPKPDKRAPEQPPTAEPEHDR